MSTHHATPTSPNSDAGSGLWQSGAIQRWLTAVFFAVTVMLHDVGLVVALGMALVAMVACVVGRGRAQGNCRWTPDDTVLSVTFASPFVFKLVSASWSQVPAFGLENAGWHFALILWPLVLLFYAMSHRSASLLVVDRVGAALLLVVGAWACASLQGWGIPNPMVLGRFHLNSGVYSQMIAVLVVWALLAATRPEAPPLSRIVQGVAWLVGMWLIVWMNRRIELLAALAALAGVAYWRWGRGLGGTKVLLIALAFGAVTVWGLFAFVPKFSLAVHQAQSFFAATEMTANPLGSADTRLEMYGRAWKAFLDSPWWGYGSGVRPYLLGEYAVVFNGDPSLFAHRHFHSMWVEMLVEGGIVWTVFAVAALAWSLWITVVKGFARAPEVSLSLAAVWWVYGVEGLTSANLVYGAPTVFWVVSTALLWSIKRQAILAPAEAPPTH